VLSQSELNQQALELKRSNEAKQLIHTLAMRLAPETLAEVLEQLLGGERPAAEAANFRAREFREFLRVGRSTWYQMLRDGRIPEGVRISPGITIWSRETVIATAAKLAEEQREREGRQK
jgi:predicted DNA-binding transcriptional regulator AlpA